MEQFRFMGFKPGNALRLKAERALSRIVERAPSDARVTALLEQNGDFYHCSLEIGSSSFPFSVHCTHRNAAAAIDKAELTALRKLDRWSGTKFLEMEGAPLRAPLRVAT